MFYNPMVNEADELGMGRYWSFDEFFLGSLWNLSLENCLNFRVL